MHPEESFLAQTCVSAGSLHLHADVYAVPPEIGAVLGPFKKGVLAFLCEETREKAVQEKRPATNGEASHDNLQVSLCVLFILDDYDGIG